MTRFFTLTLAAAMLLSLTTVANAADYRHLVMSNPQMARSTTPEIIRQAGQIHWFYQTVRENNYHRLSNKLSKSQTVAMNR